MATGMIENWVDVDVTGPIYPFVGTEGLLAILGIAFWIIWHIWQLKVEKESFEEESKLINSRGGVGKVLDSEEEREAGDLLGG